MPRKHIVFLINLVQDVNMIRPLAYLAALELEVSIAFLVSGKFLERDGLRIWQRELGHIAADVGGEIHIYESALDAFAVLQRKSGSIVAASESDLAAHAETHDVFRVAPPSFLKITLQHGYECVGFLQNKEHIIAHGRNIKFGADVICGWCEEPALTSLAATEKPKLYVSGAPTVLNIIPPRASVQASSGGLVCENLHSVRLRATGDFSKTFMDQFFQFCARLEEFGQGLTLRPHPGGMYVIKNRIALPRNVTLNSQPIYKIDLSRYGFGISAPSSVVLDMILAGIPVAVWRDDDGIMDASNYDGLTQISTLADWFGFARDAVLRRDFILQKQQDFLKRIAMPTARGEVYRRFAKLLANGTVRLGDVSTMAAKPQPDVVPQRILFISNDDTPAFRQSWLKPLAPLIGEGRITCEIVTGAEVNGLFPPQNDLAALCNRADSWFRERMNSFNPEVIVCCNYSGPSAGVIAAHAKDTGVTLVCHFDDDMLLASPEAASKDKASTDRQDRHNSIIKLLSEAALISCTQARLKSRLRQLGIRSPMAGGRIHVAGEIVRPAEQRAMTRIGIVGGAKFLQAILPQLVRFMRRNTEVSFELLSSDAIPGELKEFGARVELVAAPAEDGALAGFIAKRQWDAGLCPPQDTALTNANWIAHSCAGTATVAVAGTAHDEFCGDGRGMLVGENGWVEGLEYLMDNPRARHAMVERAQRHVEEYFTPELHQAQILSILGEAMALTANTADERWPHEQAGSLAVASLPAAKRIGLQ